MSRNANGRAPKQVANPYVPTPQEQASLQVYLERRQEKPAVPALKVEIGKDGATQLAVDHPDQALGRMLLMEAIGIPDSDVLSGFIQQLISAGTLGRKPTATEVNFALKSVIGIEPRDAVEAMLAAQMVAVHAATMTFARRLNHVENIAQQDSAERAFNKLNRTFVAQVEALKRYRTGGEQKVTVEHVTVNEGGQAIVGNVSQGGGRTRKGGSTA